jgi:serine protease
MMKNHRGSHWFRRLAGASLLLTAASPLLTGCSSSSTSEAGKKGSAEMASSAFEASEDIPGQIVVDFRDSVGPGDVKSVLTDMFGVAFAPTALEEETRIEIAQVPTGRVADLLDKLNHDSRVEYAEPLARVHALFVPNDPLLKDQWHLDRVGAPTAWNFSTGRGAVVAVVDTGIACEDHGPFMKGTDLANTQCVAGFNFVNKTEHANDDQGHGTHVAGTIAQSTNNGVGAAGMAFNAKLMPVKVLDGGGSGTTAAVADGIRWAADHGAQVINLSLGGPRPAKVIQEAVDHARSKGSVVIAAAGNSGGSVGYPGGSEGVIGVSASNLEDKIATFSSRGPQVDIAAPGVDVVQQTICNGGKGKCERYPAFSGTSMATPHVAGAAAMLVSHGVTDPDAIESALKSSARVVDSSDGAKNLYGAGILSASAAVSHVAWAHALTRLLALGLLAGWAFATARKSSTLTTGQTSVLSPTFWLTAIASGVGLLFFAPLLVPFPNLAIDVLSRPLADLDLLFLGANVHRYLPAANVLLPFGLTALLFGVKGARPAIAGLSLGTAAYLISVAWFRELAFPFGSVALMAWASVNAAACAWLGRFLLAEDKLARGAPHPRRRGPRPRGGLFLPAGASARRTCTLL